MRRIFKIVATVVAIQLLMNIPAMAHSAPRILLIAREPLKPGAEAEYDRIESETATLAAKRGCPHPYLALQPLSGAKNEVWWFSGFDSQDELNLVAEAYKTNAAWSAALTKNQKRKDPLRHHSCPDHSIFINGRLHRTIEVTLAYLKGKDAESEEAQEYANSSSLALYA